MYHVRSKHINVRYHWFRMVLEKELIKLEKVHTDDNATYMLTKAVAGEMHK